MRGATRVPGVLAACALWLAACAGSPTKRETGALGGAALGAGVGALIGHATGNTAAGAAIGGALGGVGGAVVGDQLQSTDQKLDARESEIARNRELIEELKRKNVDARETNRGVVVNLPDVLFEFNKSSLTSDARTKVRDIADVLDGQRVRNRPVSVEGHTDSIGGDEYNQRLSERRAETVASSLETEGVSSNRVRTRGFGKKYPIAPNKNSDGSDNPGGRAKNRRVEVIIEN
jgi:outer membrane protein OmpA-like peptidoglycan-associated protein